jgi:DNA-binding winged helix-turn-helix (wHTH) protein
VLEPGASSADRVFRFGSFELSERDGKLRKNGIRIKLQEQPFRVLVELLSNATRLVTREHLQQKLWPADTFVDFDVGLNTAIRKIRQALVDDADHPRYIETAAKRGYVFLMAVETARREAVLLDSLTAVNGKLAEEFWIAVLPFKYASATSDLQALAEGFSEEIVAGLSRFSYLRVTSRNSTGDYGSDRRVRDVDVRGLANDIKARYVLGGAAFARSVLCCASRCNSLTRSRVLTFGRKPMIIAFTRRSFSLFRMMSFPESFRRSRMSTAFCPTAWVNQFATAIQKRLHHTRRCCEALLISNAFPPKTMPPQGRLLSEP